MKLKDKFYVAADRIVDGNCHSSWRKPTIEAAVQHAKELMETGDTDVKYIVQIVRVVRRKKMPIQVEVVK